MEKQVYFVALLFRFIAINKEMHQLKEQNTMLEADHESLKEKNNIQ